MVSGKRLDGESLRALMQRALLRRTFEGNDLPGEGLPFVGNDKTVSEMFQPWSKQVRVRV